MSHPLPDVLGHSSWLEEVCVNYIGNAIKYSGNPPEGHIGAMPLDRAQKMYKTFHDSEDGCIKVVLKPDIVA